MFKVGLTVLFVAALAVTFWPSAKRSRPVASVPNETSRAEVAAAVTSAPGPAPAAPMLVAPTNTNGVSPEMAALKVRADSLLVDKMLASDAVADLSQFGQSLMSRGDITNALRVFRRTVELDRDSELNQYNLGLAHAWLRQTNEAILAFRTALEIFPDFAEAHNSLGLQLAALGDLAGAEKHYRAAIELEPEFPLALNNLGTVLARRRDYEFAISWFEKAIKADTNYVDARFNLASALLATGHTNDALGRFQDIVNQYPDHRPSQMVLMRLMSAEEKR